ncbi:hypothetical protein [Terrabacter sp. NPDC000476]|uniref:hypothetical protein n=1 Tax=Terrabacter sp. NPDC000476 TaxID=3154258 RepID=UPI003333309F
MTAATTIATAPSVMWPLLVLFPILGFVVGVACHRSSRKAPEAPVAYQPCRATGHRYQPWAEGWRCSTCDEVVVSIAVTPARPRELALSSH